ncbi:hypothetical protein L202_07292 [Cryptococcus amylolentus CBS 6039]|uniref:Uncharacterized protein n=2 Tax=Cryptococcus amylolentus TaxID=104669 RepID=A0A1E3HBN8_9TREE|nr:hypothetical protein L202_07292 [Cryptococcus amylolentus CBS 6039]ODN73758.1 hypothetical protein L202_07292 [Cryptococcus amylolentus CBS 6039]ODO00365.1 hypothetical protein I350_07001 [Cryptococcus amylolentus CBS 6273]
MSMSGDFDESEDGSEVKRVLWVRMAICQCVNDLVTRQAEEVLFTTYSLGFVVSFDRRVSSDDGKDSLHLRVSPMVGHQGRVISFDADGRYFHPRYDAPSRLTEKLLGLLCGFSLPSLLKKKMTGSRSSVTEEKVIGCRV